MHLRIRNTLSGKIEDFKPVDCNNVRMYVCGPTVYDRAHLGNARPAVVFDVLYRILKKLYSNVTYVRNITDVDDKIYARAIEKGISITDLTEETTRMYHSDTEALNVLLPDAEPKATDHIKEMIDLISVLIESKHAYVSNNHVYFDVSSFRDYGKLSRKNTDELLSGARVDISEHKKSSLDFVLWKPTDENFKVGWKSPWGIGRPGWHIECSAMSLKYLGEFFDIHGGGIDLIFPHHENEIAQSCAISGRQSMAKYWIHNGHLTVDGEKMSKSLGNFFTVHELLEKYDGEVIRLSLLMSNYSSPLNFSYSLLEQAKNMLDRWYNSIKNIRVIDHFDTISGEVFEALLNDMNTPNAISHVCKIVDEINTTQDEYRANVLIYTVRELLGLLNKSPEEWFMDIDNSDKKQWIFEMIEKRDIAKKSMDYKTADFIRDKLSSEGIILEDTETGTIWKKK